MNTLHDIRSGMSAPVCVCHMRACQRHRGCTDVTPMCACGALDVDAGVQASHTRHTFKHKGACTRRLGTHDCQHLLRYNT
jgi:hypothetical protein